MRKDQLAFDSHIISIKRFRQDFLLYIQQFVFFLYALIKCTLGAFISFLSLFCGVYHCRK